MAGHKAFSELRDKLSEQGLRWEKFYLALLRSIDSSKPWTYRDEPKFRERRRARRIRDKQRMKARARRLFASVLGDPSLWKSRADFEEHLQRCERLADNLAHCSKRCCNKRRKWEGPTIQERRASQGE